MPGWESRADLRGRITALELTLAETEARLSEANNALAVAAGDSARRAIILGDLIRGQVIYEAGAKILTELILAQAQILAAQGRYEMINEALAIKVVTVAGLSWIISADEQRVILGVPSLIAATKIAGVMVEETYELAEEMEGGDEEILYRALRGRSDESSMAILVMTARELGDL